MIDFGHMTSIEFSKLYKEDDVVCVLAQALAEESLGRGYNIVNKSTFIRQKYIDLAEDLIEKLEKHNLIITHTNTEKNSEEVTNDEES